MKEVFRICALFISLGLSSVFGASTFCTIQVYDGHYLTAVGGGGRITNVLNTDRTRASTWETFKVTSIGNGPLVGIQTYTGHYLTAVGGGGKYEDAIHSDATQLLNWEIFKLIPLADGWYAIQTYNGHYLAARGPGGQGPAWIDTMGKSLERNNMFKFSCRPA